MRENEENCALMHTQGRQTERSMVALGARSGGPGRASFGLREAQQGIVTGKPYSKVAFVATLGCLHSVDSGAWKYGHLYQGMIK